jgi:hypothetical protein
LKALSSNRFSLSVTFCTVAHFTPFTALFTMSIFFIWNQFMPMKISDNVENYLQAIWERTGWTNTKLQRVERRLGTDRNRRR